VRALAAEGRAVVCPPGGYLRFQDRGDVLTCVTLRACLTFSRRRPEASLGRAGTGATPPPTPLVATGLRGFKFSNLASVIGHWPLDLDGEGQNTIRQEFVVSDIVVLLLDVCFRPREQGIFWCDQKDRR